MFTDGSRRFGQAVRLGTAAGLAAAWRRERERAEAAEASAAQAVSERQAVEKELRAELNRERQLVSRVQHSRRAEREWNRELRSQLARLHARPAITSVHGDVRALVLEAACGLLEAEKGLLVSSADADADGLLDTPVHRGFEHDPTDSALAQRFGREVLERDETIREAAPADEPHMTDADREIENLVAIPLYLRDRFNGVVVCANRPGGFDDVDEDLLLALGDHAGQAMHTSHLRMDLAESHRGAVQMLLEALAARDVEHHRQSAQLAALGGSFAEVLGLDQAERETVVLATLLRDLGYLMLPEAILQQPGPLTADERAVVELHPRTGFMVLRRLPVLRDVASAVLYHHEHFDGSGYPFGLARDELPLTARVVALLDAFSAMTNDRPYRLAMDTEDACRELVEAAGTQFDPELAALFTEHVRRGAPGVPEERVDEVLERVSLVSTGGDSTLLGALSSPELDPLTLLGDLRAFRAGLAEALAEVADEDVVVLVLLQLEELGRINEEQGAPAGDRLVQAAARASERAAARIGGAAYRVSGRRFAVVSRAAPQRVPDVLRDVHLEFVAGPSVRTSMALGRPSIEPDHLMDAARSGLRPAAR